MINKFFAGCGLLILSLGISSCKKVKYQKDVADYYPKVATSAVSIEPNGSARITGNVISTGSGELTFVGFCMDTKPHPEMHFRQKLVHEIYGTSFTDTFANLDATQKYYVRSFAANEYGYAYGEDLVIENAGMDTGIIPCHPAANTIKIESGSSAKTDTLYSYSIDKLDPITHDFSLSSANYSWGLDFEFNKTPTSGVYKIWGTSGGNAGTVTVLFSDPNLGSYYMTNGGTVYVQQVDASRIRIWMCHQEVTSGKYITTSFTTK